MAANGLTKCRPAERGSCSGRRANERVLSIVIAEGQGVGSCSAAWRRSEGKDQRAGYAVHRADLLEREAGERESQRERERGGEREREEREANLLEREAGHGQGLVDGRREPREQVLARRLDLAPRDL
jgi:hypothetical protein